MGSHKGTERGHIIIPNQIMNMYRPFNFLLCKYNISMVTNPTETYIQINSYTKAPRTAKPQCQDRESDIYKIHLL